MPRTRTSKPTDVPETILDQFAGPARPMSHGEVEAITTQFKKAMVERMLGGELTHHVGYPPGGEKPPGISNQRNGTSGKTVLTDDGPLTLDGGPLGPPVSDRRRVLATRLAARHPFFAFPPAIRRVLYTTHALESAHAQLRKILKTRGHFSTDEAATKLIWLALRNITAGWWKAANYWHLAMNQFAILYDDRFTRPLA